MSTVRERHRAIIELLRQEGGRLSVNALSERLGVSSVTIRHDLRALAEEKIVDRIYGGAVLRSLSASPLELSFETRIQEAIPQKEAIARYAASLVRRGYGIALDGSTTAFLLVPHLKQIGELTIVTNSLFVAQQLRDAPRLMVYMPSGRLRGESGTVVGSLNGVPALNLNLGFFGAWGISPVQGITDVSPDEVAMRRAMMAMCLETIIIVDGRKWGEVAPYTWAAFSEIGRIITDDSAPLQIVEEVRRLGVTVDVVPVNNGASR
jgi:DeoR/GlpR family transcriptional regulator of sugar metabolism